MMPVIVHRPFVKDAVGGFTSIRGTAHTNTHRRITPPLKQFIAGSGFCVPLPTPARSLLFRLNLGTEVKSGIRVYIKCVRKCDGDTRKVRWTKQTVEMQTRFFINVPCRCNETDVTLEMVWPWAQDVNAGVEMGMGQAN